MSNGIKHAILVVAAFVLVGGTAALTYSPDQPGWGTWQPTLIALVVALVGWFVAAKYWTD